jgi:uncharacterized DUF497 family protein
MGRKHSFELGTLCFAWDDVKHHSNVRKHGIAFEEAATTWLDSKAIEKFDQEHSKEENRWFRIGLSLRGALIVTWYAVDPEDREIRLIGARRATANEWRLYDKENRKT